MIKYILFLLFFASSACIAEGSEQGAISGKWVTKSNGPMTGAQVLLFNMSAGPPPASNKYLRVPNATGTIDSEGKFSVKVVAGSYYLVMRKRTEGGTIGPPSDGDLQYYSRDNNGKAKIFVVAPGKDTNIGTISEATVFKKEQPKHEKGMTAIEGTVTDEEGIPVEGVRVFAYTSPEMKGMPQYASEGTLKDGKFLINVNSKGIYYLKIRNHYGGGKPASGEFIGSYGESKSPTVVEVEEGKIRTDIGIKIKRFSMNGRPE